MISTALDARQRRRRCSRCPIPCVTGNENPYKSFPVPKILGHRAQLSLSPIINGTKQNSAISIAGPEIPKMMITCYCSDEYHYL